MRRPQRVLFPKRGTHIGILSLCAALGTISQDAWSLLQTARDQDLGSPGNPGTPAQTVQSQNRNQRLFGAILNYIDATSYIYRYVSANFANDGRGLFNYHGTCMCMAIYPILRNSV